MRRSWITPFLLVLVIIGGGLTLWPSDYAATSVVHAGSAEGTAAVLARATALADPQAAGALLDAPPELASAVRIQVVEGAGHSVSVTAAHRDPRYAQAVADTVAVTSAQEHADVERTVPSELPIDPTGPARLPLLGAGAVVALGCGAAWIALSRRSRR